MSQPRRFVTWVKKHGKVAGAVAIGVIAVGIGGTTVACTCDTSVFNGSPTPPPPPRPHPPPPSPGEEKAACTTTVASLAAANTAITAAASGDVVCLSAGSYGALTVTASKSADVTLQSAPGEAATIAGITFASGSGHIVVSDFTITGGLTFNSGSSHDTIQYSDLTSSANIMYFGNSTGGTLDALVSHNKIHGCGPTSTTGSHCNEDALRSNCGTNTNSVTISYNEIYDVIEDPSFSQHNDVLQWCGGGSTLTYDHNYIHETCSQGFFIKDGDVNNVTVANNLLVRNSSCGFGGWSIEIFDATGLVLRNNTELGSGSLLRCDASGFGYTATADHNVLSDFENSSPNDPCRVVLTENHNVIEKTPWTFTPDATDVISASPAFVNPAADDFRLVSNPNGIGVDWKPSDFTYGPRR